MKINKDGTVQYANGAVVEVCLHLSEQHDPNHYYAKCLSTGVKPILQVLDAQYPDPIEPVGNFDPPYAIWREVPDEEVQVVTGEIPLPSGKTYVVNLQPGGTYEVVDRRKRKKNVVDTFDSIEEAAEWITTHECSSCGRPLTEASPKNCLVRHFGDEDKAFSFG
jgi:hypothetical protein